MWKYLIIIHSIGFSLSLKPDLIKEHCHAFDGQWLRLCESYKDGYCEKLTTGHCFSRKENQQKPVYHNLKPDFESWCKERGGKMSSGFFSRCKDAKSKHGLVNYPTRFKLHSNEFLSKDCASEIKNKKCFIDDPSSPVTNWDYSYLDLETGEKINGINDFSKILGKLNQKNDLQVKDNSNNQMDACHSACLDKCHYQLKNPFRTKGQKLIFCSDISSCLSFNVLKDKNSMLMISPQVSLEQSKKFFDIDGSSYLTNLSNDQCIFYHTKNSYKALKQSQSNTDKQY